MKRPGPFNLCTIAADGIIKLYSDFGPPGQRTVHWIRLRVARVLILTSQGVRQ
jgi:hypothetical protein